MLRQRRFISVTLSLGVALAVTCVSLAQPPVRVERRDERRDDRRDERATLKAKQILGSKLSLRGGQAIGTVDDIVFSDDGSIEYLVAQSEGKYVLVPWEAAKFDHGQRMATVEIVPERFREVPTFTLQQWPNFNDTQYREKLYGYYGVRPRVERRIERREERREPIRP